MTKSLSELEKQLAAVEKELQEYKEAMIWLSKHGCSLTLAISRNEKVFLVMEEHPEQWEPSDWKEVGRGSTPLLAIQAAMKLERKGE